MSLIDTNKQTAYEAAYTAFKRHEAWGWHLMTPFKEGASAKERAIIQEGIDTYHRLHAALMGLDIPPPTPINSYRQLCNDSWKSQNSVYYTATKHFRRFAVKDGLATFQVAKDGACYEDMPLDVEQLLVPGLRLWASVLRLPYASKMCRHELRVLLQPVLALLRSAC
jgi:hypothetical protein